MGSKVNHCYLLKEGEPERMVIVHDDVKRFVGGEAIGSNELVVEDVVTGKHSIVFRFDVDYSQQFNAMEVLAWASK